jgi:glutamine synthetase
MARGDRLTMADLDFEIEKRAIDSVLVAFTDGWGRLVGRRVTTEHFKGEILPRGMRVPAYLLATDAAGVLSGGDEVPPAALPDLHLRVDLATLFRMPWQAGTVGVLGDLELLDGTPATVSPRAILRRQIQRAEAASLVPTLGAEPQFSLFSASTSDGQGAGFDGLAPAGSTGITQQAFHSARTEPFQRRLRLALSDVPVAFEGTSGLHFPGGHEVTLLPGDPLRTCDNIMLTRAAVRDIAAEEGLSASFMAAYRADAATACHISVSLRTQRGGSAVADRYSVGGLSEVGRAFVAGLLEHAAECSVINSPSVNSYRRVHSDPLSPSTATWGVDNRTCAIRILGEDINLRIENRLPGSDANPYLAAAAMLAAGLDGIARQLHTPEPVEGDAHRTDSPPLPVTLGAAREAWLASEWVRSAFGADVQAHIGRAAEVEIDAMSSEIEGGLAAQRRRYFDAC